MQKVPSDDRAPHCGEGGSHGWPGRDREAAPEARADLAVAAAAGAVERCLAAGFYGLSADREASQQPAPGGAPPSPADPDANAALVKAAARRLGADRVGICEANRGWLLPPERRRDEEDLPAEYTRAVVMAVAMDPAGIATSPAPASNAATRVGYMRMAVCASGLSVFLRECGYGAVAYGNGMAFSIPLAVAAGLGELGRNDMLITPDHGPCVRICKVFTDMPIRPDRPVKLGVREFCDKCGRCIEACHAGAIASEWSPSESALDADRPPSRRIRVDGEKCRDFWSRNGSSCATCIAVCPLVGTDQA